MTSLLFCSDPNATTKSASWPTGGGWGSIGQRGNQEKTMPVVSAEKLMEIAESLLLAAGASQDEAKVIAKYNIGANLVGHDSHGIILIPTYIDRIKVGHIVPQAPWTIMQETDTTTVIDGNWGFGYHVTDRAMRYTIEKART